MIRIGASKSLDTLKYLDSFDPSLKHAIDDDGKTAIDYANMVGDSSIIDYVKKIFSNTTSRSLPVDAIEQTKNKTVSNWKSIFKAFRNENKMMKLDSKVKFPVYNMLFDC